ncbi:hypothetical protein UFOVP1349_55 [uncultured Caudovirales phage]|uniref:Uncharacterized protein n=1 Tax=uncultured Caudovirales phage TaxID=2100421 RepID=A0A6J5QSQ0_9CAUD|nr:hypothetical protein UFOVP925_45 [uncultured Caudovirales phage]CAB4183835.1 hypothetical protein UFOVP1097_4 [uncultured Caudovirales phage]CAB4200600.1 hypothetical protein UFOVP1349_55 [uncultured Caudovirales phage]CAB4214398.1 hypothetical protein UFOVP1456_35 [uncultured Caudovirales phage]
MKLDLVALGCVGNDIADRNIAYAHSLGVPELSASDVRGVKLAVVGGGPSVKDHIQELRDWDGDVWAVNGAYLWCEDNGIDATFFSVDPMPDLAPLIGKAPRVFLASVCDPAAFDAAGHSICRVFHIGPGKLLTGATSATAAAAIAPRLDFQSVTFFGCEGSYSQSHTHVYAGGIQSPWRVLLRCGGEEIHTDAGFLMQAEFLSAVIHAAPSYYSEQSGGLLAALVKNPDYDVIAMSPALTANVRAA